MSACPPNSPPRAFIWAASCLLSLPVVSLSRRRQRGVAPGGSPPGQKSVMSNDSYYVGHPANYTPPEPAAPEMAQEPQVNGGEQNPASAEAPETNGHPIEQNQPAPGTVQEQQLTSCDQLPVIKLDRETHSYFVGQPIEKTQPVPATPPTPPPPPAAKKKGSNFLAKCCYCCPCLFGGGSSSEK